VIPGLPDPSRSRLLYVKRRVVGLTRQRHYASSVSLTVCRLCGSDWERGEFSASCDLCGGGAMDRPCVMCGGRCDSRWTRAVLDSQDSGIAHWHGSCALPPAELAAIMSDLVAAAREGPTALKEISTVLVELRISGGFTGRREALVVSKSGELQYTTSRHSSVLKRVRRRTPKLTSDELEALTSLVASLDGFTFEIPSFPPKIIADAQSFTLSWDDTTVGWSTGNDFPTEVGPLFSRVRELMERARS
jgi:hypothetical protein